MFLNLRKISRRNLPGPCSTLSNSYVCTVQCTVYMYISVSCTNLPQILRLLFCLLIYIHLYNLWMGTIGDGSMDRYQWYRSILSIDTFGLIFIDDIDPSVKDFLLWSIVSTIDHKSFLWPMAIDPSVHTESILSINWSNY